MDSLDRMYRHLVRTIRSRYPQYLTQSFDVAELHQTILPYRHHRRELGLETNEDYEITLTELLAGSRDYLAVDDRMRDALRAELASTNPDPSAFKQFAGATVSLSPSAMRSLEAGPEEDGPPQTAPEPARASNVTVERHAAAAGGGVTAPVEGRARTSGGDSPTVIRPRTPVSGAVVPVASAPVGTPSSTPASQPTIAPKVVVPQAGERCRSCNEVLPAGRPVTFCPHCGQNLTTMNCPACGSELEVGWKYCPTCGRPAA